MRRRGFAVLILLLLASFAYAANFGAWNGVTVGTSAGNISGWNGGTLGASAGNVGAWNGLVSPSAVPLALEEYFTTNLGAFSQVVATVEKTTDGARDVMRLESVSPHTTISQAIASLTQARGCYLEVVSWGPGGGFEPTTIALSNHASAWNSDSYSIEITTWENIEIETWGTNVKLFKNGTTQIGSTYVAPTDTGWEYHTYRLELASGGGIVLKVDGTSRITGTDNTTTSFQKCHVLSKNWTISFIDSIKVGSL